MRRVRKLYLDVSEGQIHCRAADGEEPAILHKTASSSASYEPLMRRRNLRIGRAQAYASVARHKVQRRAAPVTAPVLLLSSPGDYFHATLDRAQALFPKAKTVLTGGANFQPTTDAAAVARAVERFVSSPAPPTSSASVRGASQ